MLYEVITRGVANEINDRSVAFTHPEWKQSWRGSRIRSYRRFGRTEWNISDIVLENIERHREEGAEARTSYNFV